MHFLEDAVIATAGKYRVSAARWERARETERERELDLDGLGSPTAATTTTTTTTTTNQHRDQHSQFQSQSRTRTITEPPPQAKIPDDSRPGVWTSPTTKLCSVGIHFRRGVSSFGLGFNISDEVLPWFERIVACGIPESRAVSLAGIQRQVQSQVQGEVEVDGVAACLAKTIAESLGGVDGVEKVDARALGEMVD